MKEKAVKSSVTGMNTSTKGVEAKKGQAVASTRYSAFGIVRDKNGKPRIDDPSSLHPIQINMLTAEEKSALKLWPGVYGRDADGWKRFSQPEADVFKAEEPIRALGEIVIKDQVFRVVPRVDLKKGDLVRVRRN